MNFLFWNLNTKDLKREVTELCEIYDIDVLMLVECGFDTTELLYQLNHKRGDGNYYFSPGYICQNILIFSKFGDNFIAPIEETIRTTARRLFSVKYGDVLLIVIHFQSLVNWISHDQTAHIFKIKRFIDSLEKQLGHKKTIICGDFNMNPFDNAIVQSTGLHAVMEKNIALKEKRVIDGDDYYYFYNPMWGFLGDLGRGDVSGTYYYNAAKPINYFWNIFDQVLIRPDLITDFDDDALEIITTIGSKKLLTNNNVISSKYSDHLPIKFTLNI